MIRAGGRSKDQLRKINITYDVYEYAAGSVLFEIGQTKVLCAVTLQQGVPSFLKGQRVGWLTAEYAMLPASTKVRIQRDEATGKRNGRSVEISRLIGRSLRSIVNLSLLGERTIIVDCDVLQADGGTRAASITGACLALEKAVERWIEEKIIKETILTDRLAAISVGIMQGTPLLDLDFAEDNATDADFNFVLASSGAIVEMQGSAEKVPVTWNQFEQMKQLAQQATEQLFQIGEQSLASKVKLGTGREHKEQVPLFSLKNR